ncbi:MAG: efflux RND transporter periplasmic adaptor subunit [Planctomycetales bacterium]|nr:efflux RND transporter periplasmic adaptor subunit [Planctomycetales bacterium]
MIHSSPNSTSIGETTVPLLGARGESQTYGNTPTSNDAKNTPECRLFDANALLPDGSDESLYQVIGLLENKFRADLVLGIYSGTGRLQCYSKQQLTIRDWQPTQEERSALYEVTRASLRVEFASSDKSSSAVCNQLRVKKDATLVLGIPVALSPGMDRDAIKVGIILWIDLAEKVQTSEAYNELLGLVKNQLPNWLNTWRLAKRGRSQEKIIRKVAYASQHRKILLQLTLLLAAALFILPVPYWPSRKCTLQPSMRQYLTSPIEGRVMEVSIRPGDTVEEGQLIAKLDDEQIRWQIADAEADFEAAGKRRENALAQQSAAEMRLAQLDQQRAQIQIDSLSQRLERLEIRSPVSGVVLQGDWFKKIGAPVSKGESLFEIAPLDTMTVEVKIQTADLGIVNTGQNARLYLPTAGWKSWDGHLQWIDPRGETDESEIYFVAEMEVSNHTGELRPGMEGRTRIHAGWRSLGWILLNRPYSWLINKLSW